MTLYRKYRPQRFAEIEGQEHIVQTLKNELRRGAVTHAYIFAGPRGTGKTSIARILAKAMNCQNRTASDRKKGKVEPCNRCVSCKEIMGGRSLDLIEIDAASNRGIDEIRALRENTRFAASKNAYKVFIIDEVHMLTREAFNALLKTLEEPPKHTLFILATTEIHKVLPTILSRCQRFDFHKLTIAQIKHRLERLLKLEKRSLDPKILNLIALKADGAVRDAESLLGQLLSWPSKEISYKRVSDFLGAIDWSVIIDFFKCLAGGNHQKLILFINKIFTEGHDLVNFNERLIDFSRALLMVKINPKLLLNSEISFTKDQEKELLGLASHFSLKDITRLIKLMLMSKKSIAEAVIAQLPLELAIVEFLQVERPVKIAAPRVSEEAQKPQKHENVQQREGDKVPAQNVSFDQVIGRWNQIIEAVQPLNHSLCAFLKLCKPVAFKNGALVLGFPRKFHKNIVSQTNNKKTIEGVLDKVLGGKWQIQCESLNPAQETQLTKDALEVLGGEMVN